MFANPPAVTVAALMVFGIKTPSWYKAKAVIPAVALVSTALKSISNIPPFIIL